MGGLERKIGLFIKSWNKDGSRVSGLKGSGRYTWIVRGMKLRKKYQLSVTLLYVTLI